ncbi:glycoside hydrolase family 3 N-terminal domain-containing protein [Kitasatospora azatica]|uniref:glycoside hydrolase family 3 N-terminal domain-containing protein n=1 Tax=Kitasatospora azatica TaxID=58347 RepID=UPI00055B33AB|nr:glycoside hydrolase family 3 N-terminal domain-containing protein [Kitasatospora azatica]
MNRSVGRLRLQVLGVLLIGGVVAACSSSPAPTVAPSRSPAATSAPASPRPTGPESPTAGSPAPATPPSSAAKPTPSPSPSPTPTPTLGRTATLTQQQLVGQRIVYSYPGLTPPAALLQHIRAGEAAGVIFFGQNISSPAQLGSAIAELRQAQADSPVHEPLLLMTDQEGGQVRRLPGAPALSAKQIGQTGDPSAAASAGSAAAQNLAGVGMNVNLAPVLDVLHGAGDFIDQTQRSFSDNPSVVTAMGRAFITAQQHGGVAATAKHFPGLGAAAANQNTDLGPVTLNERLTTLRNVDEAPYPAAISAGVKLIMVSWATYPALDPAHPAGLSAPVVQQELRGRLGFTGVTITDALEAKALDAFGTTGQRAVAAAGSGMDLLLCSAQDVGQGESAAGALASALNSGQLDLSAFRAAADRVTTLRAGLH